MDAHTLEVLNQSVVLGFDYGLSRIGVCSGQRITQTASPLTVIRAQQGQIDWQQIDVLVKAWHPMALVVGLPYQMDNSAQFMTGKSRQFMYDLHQYTTLPVYSEDERLTTRTAKASIFEQGGYRALQKQSIDCVAAMLILEHWLRRPHLPSPAFGQLCIS